MPEVPVLRTPRLVLRPLVAADAPALFRFRSDPVEQQYNDRPLGSPDDAHALLDRLAAEHANDGAVHWGLTLREDDVVVGLLGYNYWARPHRRAGVGYDLSRRLWGRGLASEAMTAVLDHGFGAMGLNRVEAHTDAENAASIRMLERLGFWREGTFHDHFEEDGRFHDIALFVKLRRDLPA
jgi:ribosomal-protein-alanine N-acetyltransferase